MFRPYIMLECQVSSVAKLSSSSRRKTLPYDMQSKILIIKSYNPIYRNIGKIPSSITFDHGRNSRIIKYCRKELELSFHLVMGRASGDFILSQGIAWKMGNLAGQSSATSPFFYTEVAYVESASVNLLHFASNRWLVPSKRPLPTPPLIRPQAKIGESI